MLHCKIERTNKNHFCAFSVAFFRLPFITFSDDICSSAVRLVSHDEGV